MEHVAGPVFSASISLLAGYSFLWLAYYRRLSVEHLRSDRFALYLLGWAFVFFVLGDVTASAIKDWAFPHLKDAWKGIKDAGITAAAIDAIILGALAALFENLRVWWVMRRDVRAFAENQPRSVHWWHVRVRMRFAAVALYISESSNAALQTWYRASILRKPILLTLKNQQVYVGIPYKSSLDDPSRDFTFVKILPMRSGYRDRDTKKVTFRTNYQALLEGLRELDVEVAHVNVERASGLLQSDLAGLQLADYDSPVTIDLNDMGIVISWKEIETLTIFDGAIYQGFQEQGQRPDGELVVGH